MRLGFNVFRDRLMAMIYFFYIKKSGIKIFFLFFFCLKKVVSLIYLFQMDKMLLHK